MLAEHGHLQQCSPFCNGKLAIGSVSPPLGIAHSLYELNETITILRQPGVCNLSQSKQSDHTGYEISDAHFSTSVFDSPVNNVTNETFCRAISYTFSSERGSIAVFMEQFQV